MGGSVRSGFLGDTEPLKGNGQSQGVVDCFSAGEVSPQNREQSRAKTDRGMRPRTLTRFRGSLPLVIDACS